jgi:integrase
MLTDRELRQAKPPATLLDPHGLRLKVQLLRSGTVSKRWSVRVSGPDGVRREIGLGSYPEVSLQEARTRAAEARLKARAGGDPLAERRARKETLTGKTPKTGQNLLTFRQALDLFLEQHRIEWSSGKHSQQWRNSLEQHAASLLDLPIAEIGTKDVLAVLDPIWVTKQETASRVRQRIERLIDWAVARQHRPEGANPARLKGHLSLALPRRPKTIEHHAAIPWAEIPAFWQALEARSGTGADALRFALLTAARSGEVRGAVWSEIDLPQGLWTIPAARMKARRAHRVPLSAPALDVLARRRALHEGEPPADALVFESDVRGGKPVSDMTLAAVLKRMKRATVHGLRSSFRDWCAERTSYSREVAEMALAHTIANDVEASYRRGDLLEKRRALMADWANFATTPASQTTATVVPIRQGQV